MDECERIPWISQELTVNRSQRNNLLEAVLETECFDLVVATFNPSSCLVTLHSVKDSNVTLPPTLVTLPNSDAQPLHLKWNRNNFMLALIFPSHVTLIYYEPGTLEATQVLSLDLPTPSPLKLVKTCEWFDYDGALLIASSTSIFVLDLLSLRFSKAEMQHTSVCIVSHDQLAQEYSLIVANGASVQILVLGAHSTRLEPQTLICDGSVTHFVCTKPNTVFGLAIESSPSLLASTSAPESVMGSLFSVGASLKRMEASAKPKVTTLQLQVEPLAQLQALPWSDGSVSPSSISHWTICDGRPPLFVFSSSTSPELHAIAISPLDSLPQYSINLVPPNARVLGIMQRSSPRVAVLLGEIYALDPVALALPSSTTYRNLSLVEVSVPTSSLANRPLTLHAPPSTSPGEDAMPALKQQLLRMAVTDHDLHSGQSTPTNHSSDISSHTLLLQLMATMNKMNDKLDSLASSQARLESRVDQLFQLMYPSKPN